MINENIINQFNLLLKQAIDEKDVATANNNTDEVKKQNFRIVAIKKNISALKSLDFEIKSVDDVIKVAGIGASSLKKIDEILRTGELAELKNKHINDEIIEKKINAIQELQQIIGVGKSKASDWVLNHNIYSVSDLKSAIKNKTIIPNDKILLGLKYYGKVKKDIPRSEIDAIKHYLEQKLIGNKDKLFLNICGSYRRGKHTSGDIDVLIMSKKYKNLDQIKQSTVLKQFISELVDDKFIIDKLTDKNYKIEFMGFCKYENNPIRRIDIKFLPHDSYSFAMLYFTGPAELNKWMREKAIKKKMTLSEYGLVDNRTGNQIILPTERAIFEFFGMEYMTPEERESFSNGTK
jgi:DNA polymerase beta